MNLDRQRDRKMVRIILTRKKEKTHTTIAGVRPPQLTNTCSRRTCGLAWLQRTRVTNMGAPASLTIIPHKHGSRRPHVLMIESLTSHSLFNSFESPLKGKSLAICSQFGAQRRPPESIMLVCYLPHVQNRSSRALDEFPSLSM